MRKILLPQHRAASPGNTCPGKWISERRKAGKAEYLGINFSPPPALPGVFLHHTWFQQGQPGESPLFWGSSLSKQTPPSGQRIGMILLRGSSGHSQIMPICKFANSQMQICMQICLCDCEGAGHCLILCESRNDKNSSRKV